VDLLPLCRIINHGESISEVEYSQEMPKIKQFLARKQQSKQEQDLFLSIIDFIFTESEASLSDILLKYQPSKIVKQIIEQAVQEDMIRERREAIQKDMSTRGRPQIKTFYKLSCNCSAPGLTSHCRLCSLGQKLISIEGNEEII
jgi:hypothetical protein